MKRAGMRECPACGTQDPEAAWTDDGLTCLECGHVVTQSEQDRADRRAARDRELREGQDDHTSHAYPYAEWQEGYEEEGVAPNEQR